MHCHGCDRETALASGERVGFRDTCEGCHRDLHACLNCAHYDSAAYNECRESNAERVSDRERANRCDYFAPGEQRGSGGHDAEPRAALDALFKK